ncbi:protein disulfide isomerase Creld2-like isoform X2 [Haliotis rubra]|uniref:protein disulfide isomerase Creld2-like isoform X2 n=1 Tax=Haliotis rubra TaxID=36100 RepID=UPI001EE6223F|nr:protein disulfide isomerase Creld2-like isoform X2 [Haliotis rubra]
MSPNRWKYFRWLAIATVFFTQPTLNPAADFPEEDEYQIAVFTSLYRKYSSEVDLLSEDALNSDLLPSETNLQQEREKRDVQSSGDDVDECLDPDLNTCLQNCTNTDGGFNCTCFEGYEEEGNNCTDVDECLDPDLNTCLQNCTNTDGGFNCTCFEGYEEEGNNCTGLVGNTAEEKIPMSYSERFRTGKVF